MTIEIDYKGAQGYMPLAIANALKCDVNDVEVAVMPPSTKIPFRADWRVTKSCADMVVYVKGELLLLDIV